MTPPRLLEDPQASALAKTLLRAGQDEEPSAPRRAALAGALGLGSLAGAHAVSSAAVVSSAAPWKLALALVVGASLGVLGVASWTQEEVSLASLASRATRRAKVATAAGDGAATTARASVVVTAPVSLAVPSPAATPNASGAPTLAVSTNGAPALAVSTNGAPALAVSTDGATNGATNGAPALAVSTDGATNGATNGATPAPVARAVPTATPRPKASRAASEAAAPALSTTTAAPSRGADDEVSADCAGDAACAKQEAPPSEQARRLAAEVALLDRARAHLASGAFTAAADALSEHARTFDDGVLTAEAEVLRIDVLVQTKQRDQARARAAAFLLRYPSSPLAHRVRAISPALTPDAVGVPPLANP